MSSSTHSSPRENTPAGADGNGRSLNASAQAAREHARETMESAKQKVNKYASRVADATDTRESRSDKADRPSLGELVGLVSKQVSGLVQGEIALAKAKAANMGKQFGTAIGLLVVAGVLALYMLERFLRAAEYGLAEVVPMWAACLIVGGILLLLILILALVAKKKIDTGKNDVPAPQEGMAKNVDAVKKGLGK